MERFWEKVEKGDGCWLWVGAIAGDGGGSFWVDGRTVSAYRFAWEFLCGPIPEGMVLRHLCHNRRCVNPAHLVPGSQQENVHDTLARRRKSPLDNAPQQMKIDPIEKGDCWIWTGQLSSTGRPVAVRGGRRVSANKHVLLDAGVDVPTGAKLAASCGNARCVRPDHQVIKKPTKRRAWRAGARSQSYLVGENHKDSKFTVAEADIVRDKRRSGSTISALAMEYGVNIKTVRDIIKGVRYVSLATKVVRELPPIEVSTPVDGWAEERARLRLSAKAHAKMLGIPWATYHRKSKAVLGMSPVGDTTASGLQTASM